MEQETAEHVLEAGETPLESLPERAFPAPRPFRVMITEQAHAGMWEHARGTLADGDDVLEVGGILTGVVYRDDSGPYLEIKAAIAAEHTRNEGTEVAFTPETWAHVNRVKDERYSDHLIVGWYHTHPRFGIFLSERDRFVHRHSFPQPWAAAFVIDPVQHLEGLFLWSAGEIRQAPEYWVGQERKQWVPKEDLEVAEPIESGRKKVGASWPAFFGFAAVAILALMLFGIFFFRNEMALAEEMQIIGRALSSEQQELDRAQQSLDTLRSQMAAAARQDAATGNAMQGQLRQLESGLRNVNAIAKALRDRVDAIKQTERLSSNPPPASLDGKPEKRNQ